MRIQALVVLAACGRSAPGPAPAPAIAASAAFVDVTVVPMDGDRELPHQTVLVNGDRIVAIGPVERTPVAPGATRIDGAGKWLVPGLVDMHVHFNDERMGLVFVANGVTTVRNMWGDPDTLALRDRARKDPAWPGPSIYTSGPIVDGTPPIWPTSVAIDTPAAAVAEVQAEKAAGYDFIKVYDGLRLEVYDALAAEAKRQGMRFAGHDPVAVPLTHALAAGQASIEHMTGYLLAIQDATSTAATLPRAERLAETLAHLDEAKLADVVKATRDAGAAVCPTLVVLSRFGALDHPEELAARPENQYVAPMIRAGWDPATDFRLKSMTADTFAQNRKANEIRARILKALADAGVPILAGTDTPNPFVVPGFAIHEELELLVAAGLTPAQALHAATTAPAAWLNAPAELGIVATGARADLILLEADPLASISATRRRAGVMVRGTWYPQAALQHQLDELAASFAPKDRLAGVPPLPVDPADGATVGTAAFAVTYAGVEVGQERLAIQRAADGTQVIVAQAAGDVPSPRLATVRIELDPAGNLVAMTVDQDGARRAVVARRGTGFEITATIDGTAAAPLVEPRAAALFDVDVVATMIPFADRARRAKRAGPVTVAGKTLALAPAFGLADVSYTFDRATDGGRTLPFTATSAYGTSTGRYVVDEHGIPVSITLDTPQGAIAISRR